MKKTILLFLLSTFFLISYAQVKKVAILPTVDQVGNVGYGVLFQVRTSLTYAISNTPGYEGYDRVDLAAIMGEHDFQRTGNVSEDQIKALGKMTGAAYVLIAEAVVYDEQHIMIAAKILDVETGGVKNSSTPEYANKAPSEMAEACMRICKTLFGEIKTNSNKSLSLSSSYDSNYVDLGLPSGTLWAKTNEGGDNALYSYYDAFKKFNYKLPTKAQLEELKDLCKWSWIGEYCNVEGPNGNSITFPMAGYRDCEEVSGMIGLGGMYWSYEHDYDEDVYVLVMDSQSEEIYIYDSVLCFEQSVRLVQD